MRASLTWVFKYGGLVCIAVGLAMILYSRATAATVPVATYVYEPIPEAVRAATALGVDPKDVSVTLETDGSIIVKVYAVHVTKAGLDADYATRGLTAK